MLKLAWKYLLSLASFGNRIVNVFHFLLFFGWCYLVLFYMPNMMMGWMLNGTIDDTNSNGSKFSQKDRINFSLTRSIQNLQVNCIIASNLQKYGFHSINSENVLLEDEKIEEKKNSANCRILCIWNVEYGMYSAHMRNIQSTKCDNSPNPRYLSNISTICRNDATFFPLLFIFIDGLIVHTMVQSKHEHEHLYKGEIRWETNPL